MKSNKNDLIIIQNDFFEAIKIINGFTIRVYLSMKMHEDYTSVVCWDKADVYFNVYLNDKEIDKEKMSSVDSAIKMLEDLGLVKQQVVSKGNCFKYVLLNSFNSIKGVSFLRKDQVDMLINNSTRALLDEELKLYLFLMYDSKKAAVGLLLEEFMAEMIAFDINKVRDLLDSLERKGYVEKIDKLTYKCKYSL